MFPFDTQSVGESQWTAMAQVWFGSGVLRNELNGLAVYADSSGMQVKVPSGRGWWRGHYGGKNTEVISPVSAAHATLNRIDRAVVRVDWVNNRIEHDVIVGTAAASPTAPSLTRSGTIWEFSLAQIAVDAGVTTIAAGKITDERSNAAVCGYAYSAQPTQLCLSTTRPSAFEIGGLIFETDTLKVYVNVGTYAAPSWTELTSATISFAAPSLTLGTANAAGAAGTTIRSDATILVFDATNPAAEAIGDAAVVGVATVAARRDHRHAMPSFGTPVSIAIGDAVTDGVAVTIARSDHHHGAPAFATPAIVLGTAAGAGAATTLIRSDATIVAFDATVPTTQSFGDAAAAGSAAVAARRDHRHGMPSAVTGGHTTQDRDVTQTVVGNTVTRTAVYSYSVPGGTLGTNRTLHFVGWGEYTNNSGVDRTLRVEILYGGQVIFDEVITVPASASVRGLALEAFLTGFGATNAQRGFARVVLNTQVSGPDESVALNRMGGTIASVADSSSAQSFEVYVTHSAAAGTITTTLHVATLNLWG